GLSFAERAKGRRVRLRPAKRRSPRRVAAVCKDRLSGDPPAVGNEELDEGCDVLDPGETAEGGGGGVVGDGLGCLLSVEKGRVHRAGTDRGDGDAAGPELLRSGPGEMLDGRFHPSVSGIKAGIGG